jgi:hypothetical protein
VFFVDPEKITTRAVRMSPHAFGFIQFDGTERGFQHHGGKREERRKTLPRINADFLIHDSIFFLPYSLFRAVISAGHAFIFTW